jgi:hypothetical protein
MLTAMPTFQMKVCILQGHFCGHECDGLLLAEGPGHHTLTLGGKICTHLLYNHIIFVITIT